MHHHEISDDGNIFGQIYVHNALLDEKEIKAKTILIDPHVIESRVIGGLNNMIMH